MTQTATAPPASAAFPPFDPHPLLLNPHLQTLAARYRLGDTAPPASTRHEVRLVDGDQIVYLDSIPEAWRSGDPIALLVHGLAGCAESPYVVRVARRLLAIGLRVVRMNLRGAGAGFGLARGIYHAGRTEDVRAVVDDLTQRTPSSPIALVGFSLGGNLVLKLAAEAAEEPLPALDAVLAVNPPLDLEACSNHLRSGRLRLYDRHFVRLLRAQIGSLHARFPDLGSVDWSHIHSLHDFDHHYTAPRNGFQSAADYYRRSSAGPILHRINLPGLVVHAADDPFIPVESFRTAIFPSLLERDVAPKGGHLGYVSRTTRGGDRRWLDARLGHWLATRWGLHHRLR